MHSSRSIGHQEVKDFARLWVRSLCQGTQNDRDQILGGDVVSAEITTEGETLLTRLLWRFVRICYSGNPQKLKGVVHPEVDLDLAALMQTMRTRTKGRLATQITPYFPHAVPLQSGLWVPTVLGFDGLQDDVMFGPIAWVTGVPDQIWGITAYSF